MTNKWMAGVASLALLAGCGGGGGGNTNGSTGPVGTVPVVQAPAPSPTPTASSSTGTCTLRAREDFLLAQMREWYLFLDTLPASINPDNYASVNAFIDALTATARAQGRDRNFTYVTSIAEENAYYSSGSSAGYGVRLTLDAQNRLFIAEAFEGAPALAAGIDRGTQIVGIGTSAGNVRSVTDILSADGAGGVNAALGPNTAGTTRVLRIVTGGQQRDVSVTKTEYELTPVSSRYGVRVLEDGARRVGYINLRTFISTAEQPLRQAFAGFKAQGITEVIIDFRYNGGGLVRIAELMGDLMGADKQTTQVFARTVFRPEKSSENTTSFFTPQAQSIAPTKIAFIGTGGTASASEFVINGFVPYLGANAALIGSNTYGKPVGQIAIDRAACDDRLRAVAFATENSAGQSGYYNGLAPFVRSTCQATDDITQPLGSAQESSVARALDFLAGRSCTPIGTASASSGSLSTRRELLQPERPTTAQRETPGLF